MAEVTNSSICTLEVVPDNIRTHPLPNSSSISRKALEKGLDYYYEGYIHNVFIEKVTNATEVQVKAKCDLC